MESQRISRDALKGGNLKSGSEKIRRPPNAFMLYASDNRKRIAAQHPELCNKSVSRILGQMWKDTPDDIKQGYFNIAKEVRELHKRRYPGYVYCPRIARLQKMQRKKKKEIYLGSSFKDIRENTEAVKQLIKHEILNRLNEEDHNYDAVANSEYVPNNPGYCIGPDPKMSCEDEEDCEPQLKINSNETLYPEASGVEDKDECNLQIETDDEVPVQEIKYENKIISEDRFNSEPSMCYIPPYKAQEPSSYLSKNPQYSQAMYGVPEIPSYFRENMQNSEGSSQIREVPSYYLNNTQYPQETSRFREFPSYCSNNPQYSQTTSRIKEVPCYFPENPQYSQAPSLIRDIPPCFLENSQYSKAASRITEISSCLPESSSSFYRDTEHFPGSVSYFYRAPPNNCCQLPGAFNSPYYPCWNSQIINHYQRKNDNDEDKKPFTHVKSQCPPELYTGFRYFDRSFMPYYKNSSYALYPQMSADMKRSQASENQVPLQNSESDASSLHNSEKERLSASFQENSNSEFSNPKYNNEFRFYESSPTSPQFTRVSEKKSTSIDRYTKSLKCEQDV